MPHIIYIHGFNSSPQSYKARVLAERMGQLGIARDLSVPELSSDPGLAMQTLEASVEELFQQPTVLIGSSLGGYYATWLAERYDLRAILVNPAIYPYRLLLDYLGENQNIHTGERYMLEPRHVEIMKSFEVETLSRPDNFWVLLETGDETLDYREAEQKFANSRMTIKQGGTHEFLNFEPMCDDVLRYCGYDSELLTAAL